MPRYTAWEAMARSLLLLAVLLGIAPAAYVLKSQAITFNTLSNKPYGSAPFTVSPTALSLKANPRKQLRFVRLPLVQCRSTAKNILVGHAMSKGNWKFTIINKVLFMVTSWLRGH